MNVGEAEEGDADLRATYTGGWWSRQPLERRLPVTFTILVLVMAGFYTSALYHQINRSSAKSVETRLEQVGSQLASLIAANNEQRHAAIRHATDSIGVDKTITLLAARNPVVLFDSTLATIKQDGPALSSPALEHLHVEAPDIIATSHGTAVGRMFKDGAAISYWLYTSKLQAHGAVIAQLQKLSGTNSRSRSFETLMGGTTVLLTNAGGGAAPWVALEGSEVEAPSSTTTTRGTHLRSNILYMVRTTAIPGTHWSVVTETPKSVTHNEAAAFALRTLPLTIAFLAIAGIVAWVVGHRVTRPIRQLANAALAIGGGEYHQRVHVHERGDLGMMARAFNRMAAELERSHADLDDRVQKRTAELEIVNNELQAFSYSVSHDLRSPLRSIDGFSQALLEDYGSQLDPTAQNYLRRLRGGAQRMGQLIDDLLLLSRVTRQPVDATQIDVSAMVKELIQELRDQDGGRSVEAEIEQGVTVHGDYGLVRIALQNLIGNAWKFTQGRDNAVISIGTVDENGGRAMYVRDNGAGFDMAYASQLFSPFQRLHTNAEFTGTGIGLATVQRIVTRHGGRVWAHAAVGQGATFYFTIEGKQG